MFYRVNSIASVWGGMNKQKTSTQIYRSIASKKINNLLAIGANKGYVLDNQLSPVLKKRDGSF